MEDTDKVEPTQEIEEQKPTKRQVEKSNEIHSQWCMCPGCF